MKKSILITGGAGMIGSNLVRHLLKNNDNEIYIVDNLWRGKEDNLYDNGTPVIPFDTHFYKLDLRHYQSCRSVMENIDEVYHLADIVAGIEYVFNNQSDIFHDNILINTNVLKSAAECGVKRLLYVGTACSYPAEKQYGIDAPPLKEIDMYPANPESAYGWSKLMGEYETHLYGKDGKMKTGVLRLHNVYGPYCDYSVERSQVIPSLIRKAILFPHEDFIVWGSGNQGRSFIFVDDVVEALVLMMEKGMGIEPIQVGTNFCTSIHEIAQEVVRICKKPISIKFDTSKPEGDIGRCADISYATDKLGWHPTISLNIGLQRTFNWIEKKILA